MRKTNLQMAVERMDVKCSVLANAKGQRPTRAQVLALVSLCEQVSTEFYIEQRAANDNNSH